MGTMARGSPSPSASVRVEGLAQLQRALKKLGSDVSREIDHELREAGEIIAQDAANRFSMIDVYSAAGFRSRTKGFGRVVVQQSRRSKGMRPDFGSLQMRRALIPARSANTDKVIEKIDNMIGRLAGEEGF